MGDDESQMPHDFAEKFEKSRVRGACNDGGAGLAPCDDMKFIAACVAVALLAGCSSPPSSSDPESETDAGGGSVGNDPDPGTDLSPFPPAPDGATGKPGDPGTDVDASTPPSDTDG